MFAVHSYVVNVHAAVSNDWLVHPPTDAVTLTPFTGGLELSNTLITRRFAVVEPTPSQPGSWATWDFVSHLEDSGDTSLIRSLTPESVVTLDGETPR